MLNFHVRAGATSPLWEEPQSRILKWLLHKDPSIVDQQIQGLAMSDIAELAAWLESEDGDFEHWKSAQLYFILAMQARNSTITQKGSYFRQCIAATDKITEGSEPGALDLASMARQIFARFSGESSQLYCSQENVTVLVSACFRSRERKRCVH
jgi:hypothetical protein